MIPTLETDRLILRGHRVSDFDDCTAMWADAVVTRHIGGRPFTAQETWTKILRYVGHWTLLDFGYWAVCDRASGRFVGEVGFADFKRQMNPSLGGAPELGWVLAPWAHGRGLATEAVRAATVWGDAHFGAQRTVCLIDPGNLQSLRVAAKCGFRELLHTTYQGSPTILFERAANSGTPTNR